MFPFEMAKTEKNKNGGTFQFFFRKLSELNPKGDESQEFHQSLLDNNVEEGI